MNRLRKVLQVEDSAEDQMMMAEALLETSAPVVLHAVANGKEARAVFSGSGTWRPDVVLLDISLPGETGFSLLEFLRGDPGWQNIPVMMFSSSKAASDVNKAYRSQANAYLAKPADFDGYVALAASFNALGLGFVLLPSSS